MSKKPKAPNDDLQGIIDKLTRHGYKVKAAPVFVKKTFDIDPELLEKITKVRMKLNVTLRECLKEALILWLEKNQPKNGRS
jgi:hypothetical protein